MCRRRTRYCRTLARVALLDGLRGMGRYNVDVFDLRLYVSCYKRSEKPWIVQGRLLLLLHLSQKSPGFVHDPQR
jgi:hypothetical protein